MSRISRGDVVRGDSKQTFKELWKGFGINVVKSDGGQGVTASYNQEPMLSRLNASEDELKERGIDGPVFKNLAIKGLKQAKAQDGVETKEDVEQGKTKALGDYIDANIVENSVPLVFDPDVLGLLKDTAPFAYDSLAREGQEGFKAVFNVLDTRASPIGKVAESDAVSLQDSGKDFGMTREDVDMTIYVDSATISDFSAQASEHYVNIEDLAVGARMAEHAQFHEKEVFYGWGFDESNLDSDATITSNHPDNEQVGEYAFDGLAPWYVKRGQWADKSSDDENVSDNFLKDIKEEVTGLLQGPYAVNPNNLEIWTSYSMLDTLENELVDMARIDAEGNVNYANYNISLKGIPVKATHNIDNHVIGDTDNANDLWDAGLNNGFNIGDLGIDSSTDYGHSTIGDEGDVFIVNTQTARFRELAPLTSFPLARRGASDEIAMLEYGSLIERSRGYFGKYLHGYEI